MITDLPTADEGLGQELNETAFSVPDIDVKKKKSEPETKEKPNVQLGQFGKPLAEGVDVIGQDSFLVPNEAGQRKGFFVHNLGLFIGQHKQFKAIKEMGK